MLTSSEYALPMDHFPVGFRAMHEEFVASWKPAVLAFVSIPGLVAGLVSVGLLSALWASAGSGAAWIDPIGATVAFAGAFIVAIALWAWVLGRALLYIVPASFFLALFAAFIAAPGGVNPAVGGSSVPVLGAEVLLFAFLALVLPLVLVALSWSRSRYAITDQRAIEVSGWLARRARTVSIDAVQSVVPIQSAFGRRFGYGNVLLFDRAPPEGRGLRHHPESVRQRNLGLAFVGVRRPTEAALAIEKWVKDARERGVPQRSSGAGEISSVRAVPSVPPDSLAGRPPAPRAGVPPKTCLREGTPLVWIAPEGRYYCPRCSEYS